MKSRRRKGINRYVDEDFVNLLNEIKKMRVSLGKDNPDHMKSDWRITLAIARHPAMKDKIKGDIINADLD